MRFANSSCESSTSARRRLAPSSDCSCRGWPIISPRAGPLAISWYTSVLIGGGIARFNSRQLEDILVFSFTLQNNLSFGLELARYSNDLRLRLRHILAAHRAHGLR